MAFLFPACQKDGLPGPAAQSVEGAATNQNLLELRSDEEPTPTILGGPRANPYTAAVMAQAWNNLYGENYAYDSLKTVLTDDEGCWRIDHVCSSPRLRSG